MCSTYLASKGKTAGLVRFRQGIDQQIGRGAFLGTKHVQLAEAFSFHHFALPRYGNRSSVEFRIEIRVGLIDIDALNCRKLFNIEHIFGINSVRLSR